MGRFLVKRLGDCKAALDEAGLQAVAKGDLDAPLRIEKTRGSLDHAQSRLSAAVEGYASWFGSRTVDASLLQQVTKLDENLISLVDQIESLIQDSATAGNSPQDLPAAITLLHSRIDRRHELLRDGV